MQFSTLKKITAAGTAALLCISLAACGNASSGSTSGASASASSASASGASASASSASGTSAASSSAAAASKSVDSASASSEGQAAPDTPADESAKASAPETKESPAEVPGGESKTGSSELIVFAAASMTETLTEIAEMYKAIEPGLTITYNFDSSGTLVTQIEEDAPSDLFISAAQKQMNEIDGTKDADVNPDGFDLIEPDSRIDILENKVTLVVPEGNPKGIESLDDLAEHLEAGDILMAMGNEDVPVGQYTQKILDYYGLDEAALAGAGCITYGSNVKEVTTQVSEASVDCGIIYCTDAFSAGLDIVDEATPEMCGQVIYPAAVLKNASNKTAAQNFLNYLQTDECMEVFEKVGFSPVG